MDGPSPSCGAGDDGRLDNGYGGGNSFRACCPASVVCLGGVPEAAHRQRQVATAAFEATAARGNGTGEEMPKEEREDMSSGKEVPAGTASLRRTGWK